MPGSTVWTGFVLTSAGLLLFLARRGRPSVHMDLAGRSLARPD
ncbi:hypothetical protein [Actinoplanes philippinensis]